MALPILQDGDPLLRSMARAVSEPEFGTKELEVTVRAMAESLDAEQDGVAIAAPQVGIPLRIFLVRHDRIHAIKQGDPVPEPDLGVYINPEITRTSRRTDEMDEGCLSVRRIYGKAYRFERATVRARRTDGSSFERGGGGVLAQAFQHEIDHLDGILFIDHAHDLSEISEEQLERARTTVLSDTVTP
jgi:peptide deformylase